MLSTIGLKKDKEGTASPAYGPMKEVVPERYHVILTDLFKSLVQSLSEGKSVGYAVFFGKADSFMEDKLTLAPIITDGGILLQMTLALAKHEAQQEDADLAITISEQWSLPEGTVKNQEEARAILEGGSEAFEARTDKETVCLVGIECPEGTFFGKAKIYGDEGSPRLMDDVLFAKTAQLKGPYLNFLSFRNEVPADATVH